MVLNERAKRYNPDSIINYYLSWVETVVIAVFTVILLFTFVFKTVIVKGSSMEDTLFERDRLIISHLFYEPKEKDIVVVDSKAMEDIIIKRVVATSNQTVEIDYEAGTVKVDGKLIDEPYIKDKMIDSHRFSSKYYNSEDKIYEYKVPFGCVFVMGDNRNHSTDSREIGVIPEDEILGRVILRMSSLRGKAGRVS